MALVVFLRGVNAGGHRTFRPSILARELSRYDVVNVGAAGTFIVRNPGSRAQFREALLQKLPFDAQVMLCDGRDLIRLETEHPFGTESWAPDIIRFVSILPKARLGSAPSADGRSRGLIGARRFRRSDGERELGRMPLNDERRWTAAFAEHEAAVGEFLRVCEQIAADRWYEPPAPEKWSPADVVIHVCQSYELGRDAAVGGASMRLRVSEPRAWMLRTLLLPVLLYTKRFPGGVRAPKEVIPDPETARRLAPRAAATRLKRVAQQAATALRRAEDVRPLPRVVHAYFGALDPHMALRLLSAHTMHHARGLARLTVADRVG